MTHHDLVRAVTEIAVYLGDPPPKDSAMAAWIDKVKHIPSDAVPWIVQRITDHADRTPKNLPRAFMEYHAQWLAEHPERAPKAQQHYCGQCYDGVLWVERNGRTAATFCACYRGTPGPIGRSTAAAMAEQGWTLRDLTGRGSPASRNTLDEQLARAREDMNNEQKECPF